MNDPNNTLTWLHLSDLQMQVRSEPNARSIDSELTEFQHDLEGQIENGIRPDFTVLTGDIASSGQTEEYELAERRFFEPLLNATGLRRNRLFVVPGNHDVDWMMVSSDASEGTRNYAKFVQHFFGQSPEWQIPRQPPYHYHSFLESKGRKVEVVGIDSLWIESASGAGTMEKGALRIDRQALDGVFENLGPADLCIAILHHPLAWFLADDQVYLKKQFEEARCRFVLHGHWDRSEGDLRPYREEQTVYIPTGAVFGHEGLPRAYNFVQIENWEPLQAKITIREYASGIGKWVETVWSIEFGPQEPIIRRPIAPESDTVAPEVDTVAPLPQDETAQIADTDRIAASNDRADEADDEKDKLGFTDYASAFEQLIRDTVPPLTIGIYGGWGTGKTFLMSMIANRLGYEPRKSPLWEEILRPLIAFAVPLMERFSWKTSMGDGNAAGQGAGKSRGSPLYNRITNPLKNNVLVVVFEAWDYNGCDKLWAGLAQRIFLSIEGSMLGWYRQIRLNLLRNLEYEWHRLRARLLPYILILAVTSILMFVLSLANLNLWAAVAGGSAVAILVVRELFGVLFTPASKRIVELFTDPDYQTELGFMGRIRQDLQHFAGNLPRDIKVVIFIDDLDRCDPKKAVEVLEAMKLLLEFERFIAFLALDARVITQAIEDHYGSVLTEAQISGYEYLDKIVQIPFSMPEPPPEELIEYINALVGSTAEASPPSSPPEEMAGDISRTRLEPPPPSPGGEPPPVVEAGGEPTVVAPPVEPPMQPEPNRAEQTKESTDTSKPDFNEDEQRAFQAFRTHLDPNPRRIKRLVNVYRLVRALINQQEKKEKRPEDLPSNPYHILAWLILCEQWPCAAHMMLEKLVQYRESESELPAKKLYDDVKDELFKPEIDKALKKLDLQYDRLESFIEEDQVARLTLGDVQRLRRFTVNFNPALSAEVRLGLGGGDRSSVPSVKTDSGDQH